MPSLAGIDELEIQQQEEDSLDCVPACVATVLLWQGVDTDVENCRELLETSPDLGTEFDLIDVRLKAPLPMVRVVKVYDAADIQTHLGHALHPLPVIAEVSVAGEVLGYSAPFADFPPAHAVVVVGISADEVCFFDPLSLALLNTASPRTCTLRAFERAWLRGVVLIAGET